MTAVVPNVESRDHPHHHHGWWWKTLLAGLGLWVITIVVTAVTGNSNLVPTLILLGSFLVPFCVVLFAIERVTGSISTLQLILAFFVGGIFGVLGASLLEADLHESFWVYGLVGLIEEFVKVVLLVIFGWRTVPKTAKQGALLGATIGAGFAAFESAGYAFNAAITSRGIDLVSLLETELVRAILAPVGHVMWTAILGAVIFGAAGGGRRFRWSWWILLAYACVSLLHAAWDSAADIASFFAVLLTGDALQQLQNGALQQSTANQVEAWRCCSTSSGWRSCRRSASSRSGWCCGTTAGWSGMRVRRRRRRRSSLRPPRDRRLPASRSRRGLSDRRRSG